jgi:hypothetical protein
MKQIKIMMFSKRKIKRNLIIISTSSIGIYLLISLYFTNHFFFHTEINGINVSLKAHDDVSSFIHNYIKNYELQLIERNGVTEVITSLDIGMQQNKNSPISRVNHMQNPLLWIGSLFKKMDRFYINDLYDYNEDLLDNKINHLKCLNEKITEPRNVDFKYYNGYYDIVKEIDGNKINKINFVKAINKYISEGKQKLDLNIMNCYENPKYTISSKKTMSAKNLLNRYVSTKITYRFGSVTEQLDGTTIHKWLSIDENLDITINKEEVAKYVTSLSKKYDTVGIIREFHSSTGKMVELQGGLYGWKINREEETDALYNNIKQAEVIEKEPIYTQRAYSREGNEIGNTYIEINITKQHLWYYKDGKLIVQGSVVTGNPNRGHATVLGVYMVEYKQKGATLTGPGYEAEVTYWMPFFGNIGLHDASWRYRFGRDIYLRRGSHGCVNAPIYLAKTVYENIEEGTPVIVYEE